MTDKPKDDHWGSLASNLGATPPPEEPKAEEPKAEPTPSVEPPQDEFVPVETVPEEDVPEKSEPLQMFAKPDPTFSELLGEDDSTTGDSTTEETPPAATPKETVAEAPAEIAAEPPKESPKESPKPMGGWDALANELGVAAAESSPVVKRETAGRETPGRETPGRQVAQPKDTVQPSFHLPPRNEPMTELSPIEEMLDEVEAAIEFPEE
jgi:hypothetical protein